DASSGVPWCVGRGACPECIGGSSGGGCPGPLGRYVQKTATATLARARAPMVMKAGVLRGRRRPTRMRTSGARTTSSLTVILTLFTSASSAPLRTPTRASPVTSWVGAPCSMPVMGLTAPGLAAGSWARKPPMSTARPTKWKNSSKCRTNSKDDLREGPANALILQVVVHTATHANSPVRGAARSVAAQEVVGDVFQVAAHAGFGGFRVAVVEGFHDLGVFGTVAAEALGGGRPALKAAPDR